MTQKTCPQCNQPIPEYRLEDPYCDCGWQCLSTTADFDEVGWFTISACTLGVGILQILVLFLIHKLTNVSLSLLNNVLFEVFSVNMVVFLHYFIILSIDFLFLGAIYFSVVYFLGARNSNSILLAFIFGFTVIGFKFFVIDPYSRIQYPILGYMQNILLLIVTIASGIIADHVRKLRFKRRQSGSEVS